MKHKAFQPGLIFNHLSYFLASSFTARDDARLALKILQLVSGNKNLDGLSFYKDLKKGNYDPDKFEKAVYKYCRSNKKFINYFSIFMKKIPVDETRLGSNSVFWSMFKIMKLFLIFRPKEREFINFLIALCDLEKKVINEAHQQKDLDKKVLILSLFLERLFDLKLNLNSSETEISIYMIRLSLFWSALFDVYLEIVFPDNWSSKLAQVLPQQNSSGKLIRSNAQLINLLKTSWECKQYNSQNITMSQFSADIAKIKKENGYKVSNSNDETYAPNEPNAMVLKRIKRWSNGYKEKGKAKPCLFKRNDLIENFHFLFNKKEPKQCISYAFLNFLSIFEMVQFELEKNTQIPNDLIVQEFSQYPDYLNKVRQMFSQYKKEKKITINEFEST